MYNNSAKSRNGSVYSMDYRAIYNDDPPMYSGEKMIIYKPNSKTIKGDSEACEVKRTVIKRQSDSETYIPKIHIRTEENQVVYKKGGRFRKKSSFFYRITGTAAASFLLTIFAVIFIALVAVMGVSGKNDDPLIYDKFIQPVVMFDPKPFDGGSPKDINLALDAAVWSAAAAQSVNADEFGENGEIIVTVDAVMESGERLFGKNFSMPEPIAIDGSFYKFDISRSSFCVSAISREQSFIPSTKKIVHQGDSIILNVEYVIPQNQFNENMDGIIKKVEKEMLYELRKDPKTRDVYIYAVKEL